jgi:hypothetical protein
MRGSPRFLKPVVSAEISSEGCRVTPGPRPPGATEDRFWSAAVPTASTRREPEQVRRSGIVRGKARLHDDCIAIHGSFQKIFRVDGNKLPMEPGNRGDSQSP